MWDDNSPLRRPRFGAAAAPRVRWQPAADVYRVRSGWLLKIELAGVPRDEVRVTISGRRVVVAGQRRDWCHEDDFRECQSLEITYSPFERGFELPRDLDRAQILTDYRDGMLLVRITIEGES